MDRSNTAASASEVNRRVTEGVKGGEAKLCHPIMVVFLHAIFLSLLIKQGMISIKINPSNK